MEELKKYQKPNLDDALKKDYAHALPNEEFKKTVKKLKIKDSIAYKYTSKIERTMQELEKIVQELEKGDLNLDDSINKFEEGMKLSKSASDYLEKAEKKITVLINAKDEEIKEEEF